MSKSKSKRNKPKQVHNRQRGNQQGDQYLQLKRDAAHAANTGEWTRALELLAIAREQQPSDVETQEILARVYHHSGNIEAAKKLLRELLKKHPQLTASLARLAQIQTDAGYFEDALSLAEQALAVNPVYPEALSIKANILHMLGYFTDALLITEQLIQMQPDNYVHWNNAGNLLRDLGKFDDAEQHYQRAITLTSKDTRPFSNLLTTMHYRPDASASEIFAFCREWEQRFAPHTPPPRPVPTNRQASKQLRIGMISDGFRNHPVGRMIIAALEKLPKHAYKLHAYSTNNITDSITRRFKQICMWKVVNHLSDTQLAQQIREDEIDILIDLVGYHNNTRMQAMAEQPAPLLVKWVGGLINTTGLSTIDYLITDHIESPAEDDQYYTEKLIRMPGDYICYEAPGYIAPLAPPPALKNGYITLGCFNNPSKINEPLLQQWALIMQQLPDSHLFLKGKQYSSEELCNHIRNIMRQNRIDPERLIFEGLSPHADVFKAYNRVDIALDPWPYSGGLTTCEAFMMGVPVVTMPGPTFAGRHSATHLVNAGMPELVTYTWDEYRARVSELAADPDSLATIRAHLRTVLLQSPVCDADTFSGHLNNALRAIWQRYTEGKAAAALSFNEAHEVMFEGATAPVELHHPKASNTFRWEFEGKVIAVDHGGQLMTSPVIKKMLDLGTLEMIVFDPASNYLKSKIKEHKSVHYYPNLALGSGQTATLYACQSAEKSGTLKPAPNEYHSKELKSNLQVLAKLQVSTVALDQIQELPPVNWLLLDDINDSYAILKNGKSALSNKTLIIDAKVNFQPTHEGQPSFFKISQWAENKGFRFYCFYNEEKVKSTYQEITEHDLPANELFSSSALFIPDHSRMSALSNSERAKLAFIVDNVYNLKDLSYSTLHLNSKYIADLYLSETTSKQTQNIVRKEVKASRKAIIKKDVIYDEKLLKTKEQKYKLCVYLPVYNEGKYIQQTIDSLKSQKTKDVLFFISDNCSTDNTLDVITDEVAGDKRFVVFSQSRNIGAVDNFRFIDRNTNSEFCMLLSGHDYISDNYLEEALALISRNDNVSMVCGYPYAIKENSKESILMENAIYDFTDDLPEKRYLNSALMLANCTIIQSIYRRSNLCDFELRKTISPDHVMISRLLWFGKLVQIPSIQYYRRFFDKRAESQEARITGQHQPLKREDFYTYYCDDLELLYEKRDYKPELPLSKLKSSLLSVLKARFD